MKYTTYSARVKENGKRLDNLLAFYDFDEENTIFVEKLSWVDGYELSGIVYWPGDLENIEAVETEI